MLPLLLLFASFLRLPPPVSSAPVCSPQKCGNLTIDYPFWLEEADRPPCGPRSFQLTCSRSRAFLTYSVLGKYQVVRVFTQNSSFVAVDHNLPLDDGCPAPPFDIFLGLGLGPFVISRSNRELLFLSNCTKQQQVAPQGFLRTPCRNESSFFRHGDEYRGQHDHWGDLPPACNLSVVPVLGFQDGDGYVASMKRGFLLEWTAASGDCPKCMASGGQCRYGNDGLGFTCNCSDGLQPDKCDGKHKGRFTLIVSLSAAASLVFACLACLMYRQKQKFRSAICQIYSSNRSNAEEMLRKCGSLGLKRYKYSELKKITRSFKDELGEGGYGVVYKGSLQDGRIVAVKLLKGSKGNGEDFLNEVMSIIQTSHVNIVSLLGFCLEGSQRALIYEYMSNGSLQKHIYSESSEPAIRWEMFLNIAIGVARGLEYLHQGCNTRIIHFDIKPNNILLDHEFCPKIADFGLAKLCHLKDSVLSMAEARGTVGFIAPEVFSRGFGVVSTKSDVYSYGMMLLEMIQGKKNLKGNTDNSSETFFPHLVYDCLASKLQACEVTDGTEEIVRKMTLVGLWCIQMTPENRPSMNRVIEMLERDINELEMPPKPFLCSPLHSTIVSSYISVHDSKL